MSTPAASSLSQVQRAPQEAKRAPQAPQTPLVSQSSLHAPNSDPQVIEAATAAVRYLAEHGYETTTASDLADAIGISRSTFFRRFGSKEGVIFADHDVALTHLQALLSQTEELPGEAVILGAIDVMHRLIRDETAARQRSELLKQNPALRERELVITHRYERVFATYLVQVASQSTPDWAPIALAAGLVSVHNAALRRWLRQSGPPRLGALERDLRELTSRFSPWFGDERAVSRVVVASFNADATPDAVLRVIEDELRQAPSRSSSQTRSSSQK